MDAFNSGALSNLKDSASKFYKKYTNYFEREIRDLIEVSSFESLAEISQHFIEEKDYRINGTKVNSTIGPNVIEYAFTRDKLLAVTVYNKSVNVKYRIHDGKISYMAKGKKGKFIEQIYRIEPIGWLYNQPQTPLPSVVLTKSGGFRVFS